MKQRNIGSLIKTKLFGEGRKGEGVLKTQTMYKAVMAYPAKTDCTLQWWKGSQPISSWESRVVLLQK